MRIILAFVITAVLGLGQSTAPLFDGPPNPGWTKVFKYDGSSKLEYICFSDPYKVATTTYTLGTELTLIADSSNTATATTAAAHGLIIGTVFTLADAYESDTWAVADITSVVDSGNTSTITWGAAHNLDTSDVITLSGFTTDTDLNDEYSFTKSDSTSGTITTANVTDDTYNAASDPTMAIGLGDADLNGDYVIATVPGTTSFTFTTANVVDGNFNEYTTTAITTTAPPSKLAVWAVQRLQYDASNLLTSTGWAIGTITSKVYAIGQRDRFICDNASALVYK